MPHIRMRGLQIDQVASLSSSLVGELAKAMKTTEDNFTFELANTQAFAGGKLVGGSPFIEVLWFERGQEIQDQSAQIITKLVREVLPASLTTQDVTVVFRPLLPSAYYENGKHF